MRKRETLGRKIFIEGGISGESNPAGTPSRGNPNLIPLFDHARSDPARHVASDRMGDIKRLRKDGEKGFFFFLFLSFRSYYFSSDRIYIYRNSLYRLLIRFEETRGHRVV